MPMILFNKSDEFVVTFDGVDHVVPTGQFDVNNKDVADHILYTARKWKKDILVINGDASTITETKEELPTVETVIEVEDETIEDVKEDVVEEAIEETTEEITE
jgi:D-aminopeptidase